MKTKPIPYAGKGLDHAQSRLFNIYSNEFKAGLNTVQIARAHKVTEAEVYNLLARGDLA